MRPCEKKIQTIFNFKIYNADTKSELSNDGTLFIFSIWFYL